MCLPGSLGFFVEAMADFFGLSKLSGLEIAGNMTEAVMAVKQFEVCKTQFEEKI